MVGQSIPNGYQIINYGMHGTEQTFGFCAEQDPGNAHQGDAGATGHLPPLRVIDEQEPCLTVQAQGHGFGFTCVHHAEEVRDGRIIQGGRDPKPARRKRFPDSPSPGSTGLDRSFPMHCWRNQAGAEEDGKQRQLIDSCQGDQWASVGGERQSFTAEGLEALRT